MIHTAHQTSSTYMMLSITPLTRMSPLTCFMYRIRCTIVSQLHADTNCIWKLIIAIKSQYDNSQNFSSGWGRMRAYIVRKRRKIRYVVRLIAKGINPNLHHLYSNKLDTTGCFSSSIRSCFTYNNTTRGKKRRLVVDATAKLMVICKCFSTYMILKLNRILSLISLFMHVWVCLASKSFRIHFHKNNIPHLLSKLLNKQW